MKVGMVSTHNRKVGGAWAHEKGNGFNLVFNAIPLEGRVILLKHDPARNADVKEA
jgi:hypothetical protein